MTILYQQFLGSAPGSYVELIDDSKSPYRVRSTDGFEFLVSAEDFRNFYKECGSPTPDTWRHFVTNRDERLVDSKKMAKVMEVIHTFERLLQDFSRARVFVRDVLLANRGETDVVDASLDCLLEAYAGTKMNVDELKQELEKLKKLDKEVRELLIDESCANFSFPVGHIHKTVAGPAPNPERPPSVRLGSGSRTNPQLVRQRGNMKNVDMKVEGDLLTITIDLSQEFGPSKSGKTTIIASTEGNKSVPGKEHKIGLNVYRYIGGKSDKGARQSFKNVEIDVKESILTLKVDLRKEFGPSKSGKTIIVASTEGNQIILGREERIGLNVYRKIED